MFFEHFVKELYGFHVLGFYALLSPLGITGSLTSVESGPDSPAYGNSHRLSTNACNAGTDLAKHVCTLANGYQTVWDCVSFP
jgi:hypothetical protein